MSYKHTLYRLDTKYGCGGVRVGQSGDINETCPLYKWMMGKKFVEVLNGLKRSNKLYSCKKIMEEFDPF
jgi:hypothetical protein